MYTIYVNDSPLYLTSVDTDFVHDFTLRYTGKPKFMLQALSTLEGGSYKDGLKISCQNVNQAWEEFQSLFKIVEAAGGLVINDGKLLCIYRRGSWDLPKGKIDPGEQRDEAALREVEEETGVCDLKLGEPVVTTYHTYLTRKGKRALKPTYWYQMMSKQEVLTPQEEEDIEIAKWVDENELPQVLDGMYASLRNVVKAIFPSSS